MPNINTHNIFSDDVLSRLDKKLNELVSKNKRLFDIGANGPDFLFFYNAKPWQLFKDHSLNKIGSILHNRCINEFYENILDNISKEQNNDIKDAKIAYCIGHILHYALDRVTHPYIFYITGNGKDKSAYDHHRLESMIDTIMLDKYKHTCVKKFKYYELCKSTNYDKDIIANMYIGVINNVLNKEVEIEEIHQALNDWYDNTKLIYSKNGYKFKTAQLFETIIFNRWLLSGNIILNKIDTRYDVMNINKNVWHHPISNEEFNYSFFELYDIAIDLGIKLIEEFMLAINGKTNAFINIIDNKNYISGSNLRGEMTHFDLIYKKTPISE